MDPFALSTRSERQTLPAWSGGELALKPLLSAEAQRAAWRIVETASIDGRPFELRLSWSGGAGKGPEARVSVSRATRVCVFGRSVKVQAANLHSAENRVVVNVPDGYAVTSNQWEADASADGVSPLSLTIPPFAHRFRLDLDDPALLSSTQLKLSDGQGEVRASFNADAQPPDGLPIGAAHSLSVHAPAVAKLRAVFLLTL